MKPHNLLYFCKKVKKLLYLGTLPFIYCFMFLFFKTFNFKIGILSNKGRITQFTTYIEPELRVNKTYKFIFLNPGNVPNQSLFKMYRRYAYIYNKSDFFKYHMLNLAYRILDYLEINNRVYLGLYPERQSYAWNKCQPVISFTKQELVTGRNTLIEMGIYDQKYICFGIRESAYYKTLDSRLSPEASDEYSIRNPNIKNYAEMAENFLRLGYKVVKVGSVSDIETKSLLPNGVIDYTNLYRTEFNDVFIHSNANFIIAGGSGNFCLGSIFNKPIISTDYYLLNARCLREGDLFVPVKYWSEKHNRFLKYSEIIEFYDFFKTKKLAEKNKIQIVHNSPKDILEVAMEMHLKLNGEWITSREDSELQKHFNKIFDNGNSHFTSVYCPSSISMHFLKENLNLL
jgi:putative glycosyltransferase (TIGR04372 family)